MRLRGLSPISKSIVHLGLLMKVHRSHILLKNIGASKVVFSSYVLLKSLSYFRLLPQVLFRISLNKIDLLVETILF
jgi:hypothetical protein